MDEELERALAASRESAEDEDNDLQEAIRLSKLLSEQTPGEASTTSEPSIRETSLGTKRKAEERLESQFSKRPTPSSLPLPMPGNSALNSQSPPNIKLTMAYPEGGLRITRTPGRRNAKNCVNLSDIIHKEQLISACVFSFFIGDNELYDYLPLSHSSDAVPIYVGRDANMDPMVQDACTQTGTPFKDKLSNKQLQNIIPKLRHMYRETLGKNYHAFYAWSPGSSHSKILVLMYPDFLRLVITSCNMMDIDTVLGDNHWYIHDLPKLTSRAKLESDFEARFLDHLQALGVPNAFLDSIRAQYDYSEVKVHLVTSAPGVCSGEKAEKHGLLRLRRVIHNLNLDLPGNDENHFRLEICAASIGNLSAKWLDGFNLCALGKEEITVADTGCQVPNLFLFYPSVGDVKKANPDSQDAASNIGCHTRPWDTTPANIKNIFYHYESKDTGRLFHQKLILAYDYLDAKALPHYLYIGSANFSQSAWGSLEVDKKANEATCNTKLVKLTNFECGVVVPGNLIESLLEKGTDSWQNGVVPYIQNAQKYDIPKDRPWNDPRWVQSYQEDFRGT